MLLFVSLVFVVVAQAKLYINVPEPDLREARARLCAITIDYNAALPVRSHSDRMCIPLEQASADLQRAYAKYRDLLRNNGIAITYETSRESGKPSQFCFKVSACTDIYKILCV